MPEQRRAVVLKDQYVQSAVIVDIAPGRAASHDLAVERHAAAEPDFGKVVIPQVAEQQSRLSVRDPRFALSDIVNNMPVNLQNVFPSVVVEIESKHPESQDVAGRLADARTVGFIKEHSGLRFVKQHGPSALKVAHYQAKASVVVEVVAIDSHPARRHPVCHERDSRLGAEVLERAIAPVLEQKGGAGV